MKVLGIEASERAAREGSADPCVVAGVRVVDEASAREAERALLKSMIKPSDGFMSRNFDRHISLAISRRCLGVHPNVMTLLSILVGLCGAAAIADGRYEWGVAGAALFVLSTILDGCDGEIARLTYRQSAAGHYFDLVGDNVVYVAIFASIAWAVKGWMPGAILIGGLLFNTLVFVFFVLPRADKSRALAFAERLANGDFSYIVLGFAIGGRLDWFLWGAACGAWGFAVLVLTLVVKDGFSPSSQGSND